MSSNNPLINKNGPRLKSLPRLRPKKAFHSTSPCASELSMLLGCWASHGSKVEVEACQQYAEKLTHCMKQPRVLSDRKASEKYNLHRLLPSIFGKKVE